MKKIISLILGFFLAPTTLLAEELLLPEGGQDRFFRISAYYSPLPNQSHYAQGSYEADIRMNGRGTNGSDGTEVYPGMLAAPRNYPFGTKIFLPGLGMGTVHDRGGAIVPAGQRGQKHDRIDVWMGSGDEGLARALQWGKRTLQGKLYMALQQNDTLNFTHIPSKIFASSSSNISLEKSLKELGYLSLGKKKKDALLAFQREAKIISSEQDAGAGVFGPQTRSALSSALQEKREKERQKTIHFAQILPYGMSLNTKKKEVGQLQKVLNLPETDIFDEKTEEAVLAFQKKEGIVQQKSDWGAGVFGPKTQKALFSLLEKRQEIPEKKVLSLEIEGSGNTQAITREVLPSDPIAPPNHLLTANFPKKEKVSKEDPITTPVVASHGFSVQGKAMSFHMNGE